MLLNEPWNSPRPIPEAIACVHKIMVVERDCGHEETKSDAETQEI